MVARLFFVAVLAVGLASAKTYNFTLSGSTQAGSTKLDAGQYSLKLDGSKVTLKDANGRDITATAKVENSDQKFRDTEVSVTHVNGGDRIEWIGLAGSKSKVIFQ